MRSILHKVVLAPVILAAAALATNSAMAESRVTVPFKFTANGKVCPAGSYSVYDESSRGIVILRSIDTGRSFSWLLRAGDPGPNDTHVTLRFDERPDGFALRTVQYHNLVTAQLDKPTKHSEHNPVRVIEGQ
jgi:hypothetical protein